MLRVFIPSTSVNYELPTVNWQLLLELGHQAETSSIGRGVQEKMTGWQKEKEGDLPLPQSDNSESGKGLKFRISRTKIMILMHTKSKVNQNTATEGSRYLSTDKMFYWPCWCLMPLLTVIPASNLGKARVYALYAVLTGQTWKKTQTCSRQIL